MRLLPSSFLLLAFFSSTSRAEVDFAKDIQPFFAEYCLECHGTDKTKGGLALTSRAAALKTLESGSAGIVPGKPEASEVVSRLLTDHADDRMPPLKKEKRPSAQEVESVKRWVAEGAQWASHWAYAPIQKPAGSAESGSTGIDFLVQSQLTSLGIRPSPEAGKNTLLKRVYYDLLGLPPSSEEAALYLQDNSQDTYSRMVNRALASPHFGERWGRHWLDQARFADSDGFEKDSPRPDAWRYRDWVINAINADMPLDQFTVEQLAGDLLDNPTPEQILATAFHRQTLTNREGGVDQEQYRIEAVFDRTETTGSVWLAHTVGCARCHSHKYDQISQKEYYELFSFFNNADESTSKVGTSKADLEAYAQKNAAHAALLGDRRQKALQARAPLFDRLREWETEMQSRLKTLAGEKAKTFVLKPQALSSAHKADLTGLADGSVRVSGKTNPTDTYILEFKLPAGTVSGFVLQALPDASLPDHGPGRGTNGNFVLSGFSVEVLENGVPTECVLHSPKASFVQPGFPAEATLDKNSQTGWAIKGGTGKEQTLVFQLVRPLPENAPRTVRLRLEHDYAKSPNHLLGHFQISALVGETVESLLTPELRRLIDTGSEKWTNEQRETAVDWLVLFDPAADAARQALAVADAAGPRPPLMEVRVLSQKQTNRNTRILHRGEFLSPKDSVSPGIPAVLPVMHPRKAGLPDRLDLARWLVHPDNPLPSRVLANQIWMRLFGEGLVRSAGDFGVRGDAPTHPELLDLCARLLLEKGWSRKDLIRTIMNSSTYRQASSVRLDLADRDPLNRLLARQNRLRVEGEIVRDLHLAAAGQLSKKIGGPSVYPPMPPEIASLSYAGNFRWADSTGEDRYRRGMYTFFKRTSPYPDLITFDCPDANVANIRRTVSNTPLQALTTLNAQAFSEAAQALGKKISTAFGQEDGADTFRLQLLFETCLLRLPEDKECETLIKLLHSARQNFEMQQEAAQKAGGTPEIAAWTAVARIVLNTDEFITRD
jgi:Protein of unknown function (DUF1549)/Protein of unknown function (DUF1553)/Planctomycete cytochrome C